MQAKVFQSGNSQAVRIPKRFRLDTDEVDIFKRGDELVIKPRKKTLGRAFELLANLPDDFMAEGREDVLPQSRDTF